MLIPAMIIYQQHSINCDTSFHESVFYLIALKKIKDVLRFGSVRNSSDLDCGTEEICSGRHMSNHGGGGSDDESLLGI